MCRSSTRKLGRFTTRAQKKKAGPPSDEEEKPIQELTGAQRKAITDAAIGNTGSVGSPPSVAEGESFCSALHLAPVCSTPGTSLGLDLPVYQAGNFIIGAPLRPPLMCCIVGCTSDSKASTAKSASPEFGEYIPPVTTPTPSTTTTAITTPSPVTTTTAITTPTAGVNVPPVTTTNAGATVRPFSTATGTAGETVDLSDTKYAAKSAADTADQAVDQGAEVVSQGIDQAADVIGEFPTLLSGPAPAQT